MRILTRYVFREFLVPLMYCMVGFVSIYVLFELFGSFSRIADAKLPLGTIVRYFAGYLSPFFHYLAPAALMLATLYTMWNFCRHSEITAMRASGISLATVVKPLLAAALCMAVFVAWVNESYMPRYAQWAKRLRAERFDMEKVSRDEGFTYCNSRDMRIWTVNGEHNPACSKLSDVRVIVNRADGTRAMSVSAEKAEYLDGEWWFTGPKVQHYGEKERQIASPTPELDALGLRAFPNFRERPEDIMMQNSDARFSSVRGKLRYLRTNRDLTSQARDDLRYDAWSQAVAPLACLVITLLSIPAGMSSGRQAVFAGVIGALGMFFSYYGMTIGCMVMAKIGLMPPIPAALLPPVAFAVLGAFYCARNLGATLKLMIVFFILTGVYVVLASALTGKLGLDRAMAHSLAATLPVLAAGFCTLRIRGR